MTPGYVRLAIYKGARFEHTLTFKQRATGTLVDITGLGPFVFTVKGLTSEDVLAQGAVTGPYDETGRITVVLSSAQTAAFPLGDVRIGLRDALNNPYIEGIGVVKQFTPNPAS